MKTRGWFAGMWRRFAAGRVLGYAVVAALVAVVLGLALSDQLGAAAQDLTQSELQALQGVLGGANGGNGVSTTAPAPQPTLQTYQPVAPLGTAPGSDLEKLYSDRAGLPLQQFGYDFLGVPAAVSVTQSGNIQDDYILGVGDQLIFNLRGQDNSSITQSVDASGRVVLPKLPPIQAAGRTFGDFRREVETQVGRAYVSTKVFISLTGLRQITVLVTGSVRTPGQRIVSALATPLDAILLSGGISKTGSLRNIRLMRHGTIRNIDLYAILAHSDGAKLGLLEDGDRIFVPPIGATVAAAGNITRPAIYELPTGSKTIAVHSLLELAAGVQIRGVYRLMLLQIRPDGKQQLVDVTSQPGAIVREGEILIVQSAVNEAVGRVALSGVVRAPGLFSLSRVKTLHDLLPSADVFAPNPYLLLGVIVRIDPTTLQRVIIPFSPLHVVQGKENLELKSEDAVRILSYAEMQFLAAQITGHQQQPTNSTQNPAAPGQPGTQPGQTGAAPIAPAPGAPAASPGTTAPGQPAPVQPSAGPNLTAILSGLPPGTSPQTIAAIAAAMAQQGAAPAGAGTPATAPPVATPSATAPGATALGSGPGGTLGPSAGATPSGSLAGMPSADLAAFSSADIASLSSVLGEYTIDLEGAARTTGIFLVMPGTTLDELVVAANGLDRDVDLSGVEITSTIVDNRSGRATTVRKTLPASPESMKTIVLGQYDQVNFRHVFSDRDGGVIVLGGEFRYPGNYNFVRGERLSSVIERAGGMTEIAYPLGAVFTRPSAAAAERVGYQRAANELQSQITVLAAAPPANSQGINPGDLQYLIGLIQQLRDTPSLGRVTVTADPAILATRPELDPVLEPGDAIFVPRRPSSVSVSGEVLNPGSFQFRTDLAYDDYVRMAGGTTQSANDSAIFIILPDGTAQPTNEGLVTFGHGGRIPPGSTVVVPRDLRPFDWNQFVKDATQVLGQLAITAASLSVVTRN